jgi:hypothetical protein
MHIRSLNKCEEAAGERAALKIVEKRISVLVVAVR